MKNIVIAENAGMMRASNVEILFSALGSKEIHSFSFESYEGISQYLGVDHASLAEIEERMREIVITDTARFFSNVDFDDCGTEVTFFAIDECYDHWAERLFDIARKVHTSFLNEKTVTGDK